MEEWDADHVALAFVVDVAACAVARLVTSEVKRLPTEPRVGSAQPLFREADILYASPVE